MQPLGLKRIFTIVPHGVDTSKFFPLENKKSSFRVGIFGRVKKAKGVEEFIDAMINVLPNNSEWTAVIYGETTSGNTEYENSLKDKIKNADLENRIIF